MVALIANGADVKLVSQWYGPEIFQACQIGFPEVVKAMVEKGADINTDGTFFGQTEGSLLKGYTPLIIAAYESNLDLVKYLMGAGAKTDATVEGKFFSPKTKCLTKVADKTAIYYAIENGNMEMVKFLAESGKSWATTLKVRQVKEHSTESVVGGVAYVTTCFGAGVYTPSLYAKEAKEEEIKTYLKSKGL